MSKTITECLEQIDYLIYSKYITKSTIISKRSMHNFLDEINLKAPKEFSILLNSILLQAEQPDNLLTHGGLMNLLIANFPEVLLTYVQAEKARSYTCYAD